MQTFQKHIVPQFAWRVNLTSRRLRSSGQTRSSIIQDGRHRFTNAGQFCITRDSWQQKILHDKVCLGLRVVSPCCDSVWGYWTEKLKPEGSSLSAPLFVGHSQAQSPGELFAGDRPCCISCRKPYESLGFVSLTRWRFYTVFLVKARDLVGSSRLLEDYPAERVMSWYGSPLLHVWMLKMEFVLFCEWPSSSLLPRCGEEQSPPALCRQHVLRWVLQPEIHTVCPAVDAHAKLCVCVCACVVPSCR